MTMKKNYSSQSFIRCIIAEAVAPSAEEIAQLLGIKKGTVQKNIERSRLKMKNRADHSLFCLT